MNVPVFLAQATKSNQMELAYIWDQATPEAKVIIGCLVIFSIIAWTVMFTKWTQMRRAKKLNAHFGAEFKSQKNVLAISGYLRRRREVSNGKSRRYVSWDGLSSS